jgi:N-acetylglucosamine kinase-like BadF-type ATPase
LLDASPQAVLPKDRYRCGNDMVCGWAGSLACRDGINVVAGTGSICYGEYRGRSARCGGWGELFSDEGSAYWIAREGLTLFSKMSDARLSKGQLHALLVERLQLRVDLDLSDLIFNHWNQERSRIAALSQWVKDAADAGDVAAQDVFTRAGSELAQMIDATRRTLGFDAAGSIDVSYSGGAFNAGAWLLDPLNAALQAASPRYRVMEPRFAPAIGAALYAARCAGSTLTDDSLQTLAREAPAADPPAP